MSTAKYDVGILAGGRRRVHNRPAENAPVWKKLHSEVWFDPRIRVQTPQLRCLFVDLLVMAEADGALPLEAAIDALGDRAVVEKLARLGLLRVDEQTVTVVCVAKDYAYSESRKPGGKARQEAQKARAEHHAEHPPSTMLNKCEASPSSGSGSSSGSESGSGRESAEREPKPKAPRKEATGPAADVRRAFEAAFLKSRGVAYSFEGAKDGQAVKTLLQRAGGDPAVVIARIPSLFADDFYGPKATLSMFVSAWNAVAPKAQPKVHQIESFIPDPAELARMARANGHGPNPTPKPIVDPARSQVPYAANGKAV